jgi:hypothetical protein
VVKLQGLEADHSPPSSDEVKMREAIPPIPNTPTRGRAQLKHKGGIDVGHLTILLQLVEILTNISEETHCIYFTFILEMEAV